jgi:hypothetical protein
MKSIKVTNKQSLPIRRHTFSHYHLDYQPIVLTVQKTLCLTEIFLRGFAVGSSSTRCCCSARQSDFKGHTVQLGFERVHTMASHEIYQGDK